MVSLLGAVMSVAYCVIAVVSAAGSFPAPHACIAVADVV
jgi:hypothetical protein